MMSLGKIGEELAKNYLSKNGHTILEQNYKVPFGEIDLISEKDHCLCFVEVKARKSISSGLPEESITIFKKKKIIQVAQCYLKKHHIIDKKMRFDVISIQFDQHRLKEIRHIINAFSVE
ncbi:MAG: YraN family protein [Candidatus Atribacteria bacterium]|nr:YraN family protein [Candidatus Atribacteria bacterium]